MLQENRYQENLIRVKPLKELLTVTACLCQSNEPKPQICKRKISEWVFIYLPKVLINNYTKSTVRYLLCKSKIKITTEDKDSIADGIEYNDWEAVEQYSEQNPETVKPFFTSLFHPEFLILFWKVIR